MNRLCVFGRFNRKALVSSCLLTIVGACAGGEGGDEFGNSGFGSGLSGGDGAAMDESESGSEDGDGGVSSSTMGEGQDDSTGMSSGDSDSSGDDSDGDDSSGEASGDGDTETPSSGEEDAGDEEVEDEGAEMGAEGDDSSSVVCGDGVTEGEEACDDGNANNVDGCTDACQLGPRAIVYGDEVTELEGLGMLGGLSGNLVCEDGEVLTSINGQTRDRKVAGFSQGRGLTKLSAQCTKLDFVEEAGAFSIAFGATRDLGEVGNVGGDQNFSLDCPNESAVIGYQGHAVEFVTRIQYRCAPVSLVDGGGGDFRLQIGAGADTASGGEARGASLSTQSCAAGSLVADQNLRFGDIIDHYTVGCRVPTVLVGPE